MTNFIHRFVMIIPIGKVAAVVSWFQANIGASAIDPNVGPALNPTGLFSDPITHRWCSTSFIDSDCQKVITQLAIFASVAPPTVNQWNSWTQAQKIAWMLSVQQAIKTGSGSWCDLCDNTSQWDDPTAALAAMGLKMRASS